MIDRTTEIEATVMVVDGQNVVILPASVYDHAAIAGFDLRIFVRQEMIPPTERLERCILRKERPEPPVYPGARPARITRFRR